MVRRAIEQAFEADLETALQALVFAPLDVRGVHIAREPADMRRPRSAIRTTTIPAGSITAC